MQYDWSRRGVESRWGIFQLDGWGARGLKRKGSV